MPNNLPNPLPYLCLMGMVIFSSGCSEQSEIIDKDIHTPIGKIEAPTKYVRSKRFSKDNTFYVRIEDAKGKHYSLAMTSSSNTYVFMLDKNNVTKQVDMHDDSSIKKLISYHLKINQDDDAKKCLDLMKKF